MRGVTLAATASQEAQGPSGGGMRLLGSDVPGSALNPDRGPRSRTHSTSPSSEHTQPVPRPAAHHPPSPRQSGKTWILAKQVYYSKINVTLDIENVILKTLNVSHCVRHL